MGFLNKLLQYNKIYIQCHNNPDADAIASAFAVYRYFQSKGKAARIIYGGDNVIKKNCTKLLIKECGIPIFHTRDIEEADLLLLVDCQYGATNVERFAAENVAVIDHHMAVMKEKENCVIKSNYQSCSTIVYEMLKEEGYDVKGDEVLSIALLYGLYTDTSCFADLFAEADSKMRMELYEDYPLFEQLIKSNLSIAELMVASDAMYHHFFEPEYHVAMIGALKCDQTILGMIGDFVIQVDAVYLTIAYTEANAGYQISLRSCMEEYEADKIAAYLCSGIGGGGGHKKKAGGQIDKDKMKEICGTDDIFQVLHDRLIQYIKENKTYLLD